MIESILYYFLFENYSLYYLRFSAFISFFYITVVQSFYIVTFLFLFFFIYNIIINALVFVTLVIVILLGPLDLEYSIHLAAGTALM